MKRIGTTIFAIAVIAGIGWLTWEVLILVTRWASSISSVQKPVLISATALLLVPVVTFFATRAIERRRSIDSITFAKRVEIYDKFVRFFMSSMMNKASMPEDIKKVSVDPLTFMYEITPELLIYASNNVVKQWGRFRSEVPKLSTKGNEKTLLLKVEGLLKSMRKDLGHGSFTLQDGDIARMFINDIDDVIKK
jgi:hypothetical protein